MKKFLLALVVVFVFSVSMVSVAFARPSQSKIITIPKGSVWNGLVKKPIITPGLTAPDPGLPATDDDDGPLPLILTPTVSGWELASW